MVVDWVLFHHSIFLLLHLAALLDFLIVYRLIQRGPTRKFTDLIQSLPHFSWYMTNTLMFLIVDSCGSVRFGEGIRFLRFRLLLPEKVFAWVGLQQIDLGWCPLSNIDYRLLVDLGLVTALDLFLYLFFDEPADFLRQINDGVDTADFSPVIMRTHLTDNWTVHRWFHSDFDGGESGGVWGVWL